MYGLKEDWDLEPKPRCMVLEDYMGAAPRWWNWIFPDPAQCGAVAPEDCAAFRISSLFAARYSRSNPKIRAAFSQSTLRASFGPSLFSISSIWVRLFG